MTLLVSSFDLWCRLFLDVSAVKLQLEDRVSVKV